MDYYLMFASVLPLFFNILIQVSLQNFFEFDSSVCGSFNLPTSVVSDLKICTDRSTVVP